MSSDPNLGSLGSVPGAPPQGAPPGAACRDTCRQETRQASAASCKGWEDSQTAVFPAASPPCLPGPIGAWAFAKQEIPTC